MINYKIINKIKKNKQKIIQQIIFIKKNIFFLIKKLANNILFLNLIYFNFEYFNIYT